MQNRTLTKFLQIGQEAGRGNVGIGLSLHNAENDSWEKHGWSIKSSDCGTQSVLGSLKPSRAAGVIRNGFGVIELMGRSGINRQ